MNLSISWGALGAAPHRLLLSGQSSRNINGMLIIAHLYYKVNRARSNTLESILTTLLKYFAATPYKKCSQYSGLTLSSQQGLIHISWVLTCIKHVLCFLQKSILSPLFYASIKSLRNTHVTYSAGNG